MSKDIENIKKLLQLYARGYIFDPAIFHPECWRFGFGPIIKVEGWDERS